MERKQIGWAVRFKETSETKSHLDILAEEGKVLWGQWKKEGSPRTFSSPTKSAMNEACGSDLYAIGENTVWKMNVVQALSKEEVIEQQLEYLIPKYYNINTEVYTWFLIDNIEDYQNKECLHHLFSSGGNSLYQAHQIPGCTPWAVYDDGEEHLAIKTVPFPKPKPTRQSISSGLRFKVFNRDHSVCQICGRTPKDGIQLEVDHIRPVSKGGSNDLANLQTLCKACNRGKSDYWDGVSGC